MKSYLEQYLESVENLPTDLQRNFSLMKELDIQAEHESRKVEEKCRAFLQELSEMTPKERKDRLSKIQTGFRNTVDLGDQKVALAVQTYESVDKHIRRLDEDLTQFDAENGSGNSPLSKKRNGAADESGRGRKKKRGDTYIKQAAVDDMPVDPNEPTYCLCHQVSYGEMVACDNEDCPTEWFHFACVNLTEQPKDKWFCPRCQMEMDRKKR